MTCKTQLNTNLTANKTRKYEMKETKSSPQPDTVTSAKCSSATQSVHLQIRVETLLQIRSEARLQTLLTIQQSRNNSKLNTLVDQARLLALITYYQSLIGPELTKPESKKTRASLSVSAKQKALECYNNHIATKSINHFGIDSLGINGLGVNGLSKIKSIRSVSRWINKFEKRGSNFFGCCVRSSSENDEKNKDYENNPSNENELSTTQPTLSKPSLPNALGPPALSFTSSSSSSLPNSRSLAIQLYYTHLRKGVTKKEARRCAALAYNKSFGYNKAVEMKREVGNGLRKVGERGIRSWIDKLETQEKRASLKKGKS